MSRDYDSLNRLPSRPTDKRYTFELTDGSTVTVWADSLIAAEDVIDSEHPWVASHDIARLRWVETHEAAGNRVPLTRSK